MTRPATPSFAASACSAGQSAGHQRSIAAFSALRLLPALLLSAFAAAPVAAQDSTFQLGTVVVSGNADAPDSLAEQVVGKDDMQRANPKAMFWRTLRCGNSA